MTTAKSDDEEVVRILCKRLRKGDRVIFEGDDTPTKIGRTRPGKPTGMSVQLAAGPQTWLALPGADPIRLVGMAEDDSRRPYVLGTKRWAVEPAANEEFDGL